MSFTITNASVVHEGNKSYVAYTIREANGNSHRVKRGATPTRVSSPDAAHVAKMNQICTLYVTRCENIDRNVAPGANRAQINASKLVIIPNSYLPILTRILIVPSKPAAPKPAATPAQKQLSAPPPQKPIPPVQNQQAQQLQLQKQQTAALQQQLNVANQQIAQLIAQMDRLQNQMASANFNYQNSHSSRDH